MRFVVDECTGPALARWLREEGQEVFSVYEEARGLSDTDVLETAVQRDAIVITNDKGFAEMVFRSGKRHRGVILLRLRHEHAANKIAVLSRLIKKYGESLSGGFVVATETAVRAARSGPSK